MPRPWGRLGVGRWGLDTRNGSLLPGMPQAGDLTRPLSHSPEPGDEGDPARSGLEIEPEEPPGWRELVPLGTLHSLPKSQVKRQEVISGEYGGRHPVLVKGQGAAISVRHRPRAGLEGSLLPPRAICHIHHGTATHGTGMWLSAVKVTFAASFFPSAGQSW